MLIVISVDSESAYELYVKCPAAQNRSSYVIFFSQSVYFLFNLLSVYSKKTCTHGCTVCVCIQSNHIMYEWMQCLCVYLK